MTRFEVLAIEWLRALRGRSSQRAFSRRLGYRTNIAYRWESGRCFPTAHVVLELMKGMRMDVRASIVSFYGGVPAWSHRTDPVSAEGVAQLLDELRGRVTVVELARRSGFSRHRIARWLSGVSQPRLPEWLAMIEATSLRLHDFVTSFFDAGQLPSIEEELARLEAIRTAAYSRPESHLVLRALELDDYEKLAQHSDVFVAQKLRLAPREVCECIAILEAAGQIRNVSGKWVPIDEAVVDTRKDRQRARELGAFWLNLAREQLLAENAGVFSYNLFSIARRDLDKLRRIHERYYREMQDLIASSQPNEHVALFATQLLRLDE